MQIRPLTLDDFDAVTALWERTDGVGTIPRDEIERLLGVTPELVLVAEDASGEVVGAVVGTDDGRRGWIFRLAVDDAHRGQGLGHALVDEVERRLYERGVRHVRLLAHVDNAIGRRFWERAGYDGWDIVLYGKVLGAPGEVEAGERC